LSSAVAIVPPVSIVIRWPDAIPAEGFPCLLAQRLIGLRIGATWALEEPRQVGALMVAIGKPVSLDVALMVRKPAQDDLAEKLTRATGFESALASFSAVAIEGELQRGVLERMLCQAGIRAVIGGAAKSAATRVRSLPFGITEFRPHVEAPAARRGLPFRGISRRLDAPKLSSLAVVNIDLSRAHSSRSIHAVEQLIQQTAEAVHDETVRVLTISQLVGELSRQSGSRPQRSILRTAA
jgi:hypothetical protein